MALVKVKQNFQITLPSRLRKKFQITEGDYVAIDEKEDGLLVRPVKVISPGQEYFWTRQWQEGEAEADKDIAEGNVTQAFDNIDDALKALKNGQAE